MIFLESSTSRCFHPVLLISSITSMSQDGLTGSALGDWANYTASPLRAFENELGVQAWWQFWQRTNSIGYGTCLKICADVISHHDQETMFTHAFTPCHLVTNKRQTAIYSHRSLAILVHNIPLHYDFLTFHWMYALIHALQHTELRDVVLDHVPSCHIILYHFPFHDIQQLNHIAEGYLTSLSVWQYTVHTLPNICYHTMTNTA